MMVQVDVNQVQKGSESFMVSFDFTKTPVTQIADYIIIAASKYKASDIHFDPREDGMMVRFRIDGDCQDYTFVPKAYEKNLTTRLKLLANMNITESRLPQDGAIKGMFGDQYLDMRVSSLPLNEGEKIVIRILDYTRSLQGIDSLGFHPKNLEKIRRMMGIPNGIILTTGATGSGKSTTTYSILQGLNKPETNIITVEDPIEMNIEGINQVQVNSEIGMTFAAALRSILRQDPNIILIGEIRDSETAQIAVRASITGHLVLSTIHTNNALATVERLLDMEVERYLLSTALSGIISQRLAKMLCPDCRIQRETTKYEKKVFKKYMDMDVPTVWDANPNGCPKCRRGYHGRIAFHEVLELNDDIRAAISNENIDKKELAKMVYDGNTITMLQDALIKCLEGKTSFEEVYRNIEIENEDDDNYENEMVNEIKEAIAEEEKKVESNSEENNSVENNAFSGENSENVNVSQPDNVQQTIVDNNNQQQPTLPVNQEVQQVTTLPVNQEVQQVPTLPANQEVQQVPTLPTNQEVQQVPALPTNQEVQQFPTLPVANPVNYQVPVQSVQQMPTTPVINATNAQATTMNAIANPVNQTAVNYPANQNVIATPQVPVAPMAQPVIPQQVVMPQAVTNPPAVVPQPVQPMQQVVVTPPVNTIINPNIPRL